MVDALRARGTPLRALVRDETRALLLRSRGVDVHLGDLHDRESVAAACAGARAVVHCAALSAPWGRRSEFFATNVEGTRHVVDGCIKHGVQRLIHISSPSVTFRGVDERDVREDAPYPERFASTYSLTKKLAEDVVRQAAARGLRAVILRPKAIFGPGDTSLVPRLVAAARHRRLRQIGDGENLVDLTHVDNVVHAILLVLTAPAAVGRTYTITNDEHPRLWDVIERVVSRAGGELPRPHVPLPVALMAASLMEAAATITGREPTLTRYSVLILARTQTYDISAARRDLGYEPIVTLEDGIQQTLDAMDPEHSS